MIAVLVAAAACGGTSKQDSTAPSYDEARIGTGQKHEVGPGAGDKHDDEAAMAPQLAKFHDTLAPRWHAPPGPQRMTDTCAAIPQFHAGAEAIMAAPAPSGGDESAWSIGGRRLSEAVAGLDGTCKANDAAAFEPAFERVHSAFHAVMEAAGGHHDEHDEAEHSEKH